ncbi:efflux RND transporter periplasmic adaptor subunit [Roseivirga sp. BDSF3-8]|uniref:efflux RND transporter periplasmic adaptor subunit n=1 Tax=Roseivirga sp. BDSF3-8 TaxID=3241598 RepID=UPI003532491C
MKKVIYTILIMCIVVLFVGTGVFLFKKSVEKPEVFETSVPFRTDIVLKTVATGSIKPRKEVAVKSQVSGVVEKIYVEAGQVVKQNELLAKIRIIPNMVNVNRAQSELNQAEINYRNAKREMDRQKGLFDKKIISEVEYRRFELDFKLADESLKAAQNNLQLVREGASRQSGQVSNEVRATSSGMVLDVPVEEGSFVIESNTFNEGTTIVSIADMSDMVFEGTVDESEVGKIKEGMELLMKIGAIENEPFTATLEYISPKGLEEEGAIKFEIRAAVNLKEGQFIRAGYSANADIVLDKRTNVLAVKESNLLMEENQVFVEIHEGDQNFTRKEIKTGMSDGINIEVLEGLEEETEIKKM